MKTKRKKIITSTTKRWNDVDLVDVFERGKKEGAKLRDEAVKETLLKINNRIEQFETDNHLRIEGRSIRSLVNLKRDIKEIAKDLGIDLSQQRGVSSEKGEVLAETNLAKTPYPVDTSQESIGDESSMLSKTSIRQQCSKITSCSKEDSYKPETLPDAHNPNDITENRGLKDVGRAMGCPLVHNQDLESVREEIDILWKIASLGEEKNNSPKIKEIVTELMFLMYSSGYNEAIKDKEDKK